MRVRESTTSPRHPDCAETVVDGVGIVDHVHGIAAQASASAFPHLATDGPSRALDEQSNRTRLETQN